MGYGDEMDEYKSEKIDRELRLKEAGEEGRDARLKGEGADKNPYVRPEEEEERDRWAVGWGEVDHLLHQQGNL